MTPKAILLDALGTLVELQPPAPLLRDELSARFGVSATEAECELAVAAEISFYRAHLDEGRDRTSLEALRARCATALRDALPAGARDALTDIAALTEALLASLRFRAFADAGPALAAWRRQGIRLVVVSNWDVSLHDVLARVGLGGALDGVITSAQAGARKPAPEIFERALELAGVPAGRAVHVGDSLEEDVIGARAAGIEPVLVRRAAAPTDAPPGVRAVASLSELAPWGAG